MSAGGGWPGWPVTLALTALLGMLGLALTTGRRHLGSLLATLLTAQAALHWLFSMIDMSPTGHAQASGCVGMLVSGHQHQVVGCPAPGLVVDQAGSGIGMTGPGSAVMAMPSAFMLITHLAATVATAWLLTKGEAWLWRTVDWLLHVRTPNQGPRRSHRQGPTCTAPTVLRGADVGRLANPRGPPATVSTWPPFA